jgi:hypothetical protein
VFIAALLVFNADAAAFMPNSTERERYLRASSKPAAEGDMEWMVKNAFAKRKKDYTGPRRLPLLPPPLLPVNSTTDFLSLRGELTDVDDEMPYVFASQNPASVHVFNLSNLCW